MHLQIDAMDTWFYITAPDRIMGKQNVSIYRRRLSMIEKLRTFFSIIMFSIIVFFP